jgi:hypothetical protein
VPLAPELRQCTIMLDPSGHASHGAGLQAIYDRGLRAMTFLGRRLTAARQISPPWSCDASVYDCERASDDGVLLVGDAASFVETLSSAGVRKALTSAWRAAVVVNTCLAHPDRRSAALAYHDEREREISAACRHQAAIFFCEAATHFGTAFWRERHAATASADAADTSDGALADAYRRLRASDRARLRVSPQVQFEPAAAIEGREIVLSDGILLPGAAAPLRFAANIDLPALVRIVERHPDVPATIAAYQSHRRGAAPADVLRGLSMLLARRALIHEGAA